MTAPQIAPDLEASFVKILASTDKILAECDALITEIRDTYLKMVADTEAALATSSPAS